MSSRFAPHARFLLLSLLVVSAASAAPVSYIFNFASTGAPPSGGFTFVDGLFFSDLHVTWNGVFFDLTGVVGGFADPVLCGVAGNGQTQIFTALTTGTLGTCTSVQWFGETTDTVSHFAFLISSPSETISIEAYIPNGSPPPPITSDEDSFTASVVPEPASWMLAGGAIVFGLARVRRAAGKSRGR